MQRDDAPQVWTHRRPGEAGGGRRQQNGGGIEGEIEAQRGNQCGGIAEVECEYVKRIRFEKQEIMCQG